MSRAKTLVGQHWFMGNNTQSTGVSPAYQPGLLTKSVTAPFAKSDKLLCAVILVWA